jgi:hypothetical protein
LVFEVTHPFQILIVVVLHFFPLYGKKPRI